MIRALFVLFSLQLAGSTVVEALDLTVPGPVVGMAALLAILFVTGGPGEALERTAGGFLDNLGLLFVPAGVGVTLHLSRLADGWPAIVAAVVPATLVTMVATAFVFRWLSRLTGDGDE
jgi:holin-like protein